MDADVPPELDGPAAARARHARSSTRLIFSGVAGGPRDRPAARAGAGRRATPAPVALAGCCSAVRRRRHRVVGRPGALDALCEDPEPETARLALQWQTQALENSGTDAGGVRGRAPGAALCATTTPTARGRGRCVEAQLAGLAVQVGRPGRRADLRRGGAAGDGRARGDRGPRPAAGAAGRLAASTHGRLDDAERLMDEIVADERNQSVFGGGVVGPLRQRRAGAGPRRRRRRAGPLPRTRPCTLRDASGARRRRGRSTSRPG